MADLTESDPLAGISDPCTCGGGAFIKEHAVECPCSLYQAGIARGRMGRPTPAELDARDLAACVTTFRVLYESMCAGGYSASRIVERLRELGIQSVRVGDLHGVGLQDIANVIYEATSEV